MTNLSLQSIASVLASAFTLIIAILVYSRASRREEANPFVLICILISFWTLFPFATALAPFGWVKTTVGRFLYMVATMVPAAFAWLIYGVLGEEAKKIKKILPVLWGISIFLLIASPFSFMVDSVDTVKNLQVVHPGSLYPIFIIYFILTGAFTLVELSISLHKSEGNRRNQLAYYFGGFLLAYLGGTLHFISMYLHKEPIPHDIFVIAFISLLAYAIVKHRVMNVNLAARYVLVQALYVLLLGIPTTVLILAANQTWVTVTVVFCLALGSPTLFRWAQEMLTETVDRLPMFRGRYERFGRLELLFRDLSLAKSLEEWNDTVKDVAIILCPTSTTVLLVKDPSEKWFIVKSSDGLDPAEAVFMYLPMDSILAKHLSVSRNLLIAETTASAVSPEDAPKIKAEFQSLVSTICVPIISEGSLYGIIGLGEKPNREAFNDLELTSLTALSRAAEHTLRIILSGLSQEQTTSVWAHDLIKPFTLKGSFQYLEQMLEGSFGAMTYETKTALKLILNDVDFVKGNLKYLLNPGLGNSFNIVSTSLTGVFSRVRENYTIESIKHRFNWRVNVPPEDLRVFCDWSMIEHRVIANLIENAFRHTPTDGTVELGWTISERKFLGFVKDNGIGIRESDMPKLFKARSQLEEGKPGLSGLGLFSAKTVVEAHKGKIWVESAFGKGSTFFFELPLASAPHKNI